MTHALKIVHKECKMGIIKHGRNTSEQKVIQLNPTDHKSTDHGSDEIPFIPATDLLPKSTRLSDSEASAIATALYLLTPSHQEATDTPWALSAKDSSLRR